MGRRDGADDPKARRRAEIIRVVAESDGKGLWRIVVVLQSLLPFVGHEGAMKMNKVPKIKPSETRARGEKKAIIAIRKSCVATGVGLSHYVLMGRKAKS